ncbi:LCP family protein, partial [bacterium]|nr:LCP family protein [bacterium]
SIFRTLEGYEKIDEETKVIEELSKEYKKSEIAEITGDEMINYNKSASITEPFTVLVMGIDSTSATLNKNATGNGDALMLVTFNPKTLNATIMSIPRDSYVYLPSMGTENKITHAAWAGTSNMIRTIEMFTGIDIDYYVKINFQGVIKLVNLLGGITVDVPIDFCESNAYRQTSKDKQICLKEGIQTLNGEQALALARHRKSFATGDLARGTNQQLVVQGILNQAKEIKSANQALSMLDTMSKSMDTNFTTKQLLSFYDIFKTILETSANQDNLINIQQLYLSGSTQGIYDERTGLVLSDYIINQSSLNKCVETMEKNLGIEKTKMEKDMDFDIEETFELTTIGKSGLSATKLYTLLPNFEGKSISYAENWLKAYNITIEIEEQESEKTEGTILSQSLPQYKRVDLIKESIKFVIAKKAESVIETPNEPETPTSGTEEGNGNETGENNETDTPTEETPTTPSNPEETPTEPNAPTTDTNE